MATRVLCVLMLTTPEVALLSNETQNYHVFKRELIRQSKPWPLVQNCMSGIEKGSDPNDAQ